MKKDLVTTSYKAYLWGMLLYLAGCCFSMGLHASETYLLAESTMISMESEDPPPLGFEILYRSRAAELIQFLEKVALSHVPADIQLAVHGQAIRILLKSEVPTDGLFTPPPPQDPDRLQIIIRSDILAGQNVEQILTHEFFHAIHYLIHPNETPWIREGLAQLFEYRVLNRFNGLNFSSALRYPGTPLEGHYDIHKIDPAQYGHDLLYFYYLWAQCGGDSLFWSLAQGSPARERLGIEGIDFTLRSLRIRGKPQCSGFKESALHFEIARIHNKVNYSSTNPNNPKIHYLLASTLPRSTPQNTVILEDLQHLSRFEPLVLSGKTLTPPLLPGEVRLFWLETIYPYRVQEAAPSRESIDDQNWIQLLLKD